MRRKIPFSYVPALRWKKGEYCGLARLGSDVAERIAPRLVVPPSKDRDPEKGDEILYVTGRRIGEYWPMRPAFLDVHFLFPEFGEADSADWLLRILKVALDAGACPIPVATLSSLLAPQGKAFQLVLAEQGDTRIALRVESGEIDAELGGRVAASMGQLGTNPQDCALILDFADADLSDAEAVAKIALHALERVHSIGLWQQVIFQGSNYPERNPAINDSSVTVDRTEWHAWRSAIGSDSELTKAVIFGDYCADCARIEFRSGVGPVPIRHYRYCTPDSWLVVRGKADGKVEPAMRDICRKILDSGYFAGRDFSSADQFIYETAMGYAGPGKRDDMA